MVTKTEYIYKNSKSCFGIKTISNKKYFYKKTKNINKEIEGFNEVNQIYKVPKIAYCNNDEILYEYKKELEDKTIHEYLYNKEYLLKDIILEIKENLEKDKKLKGILTLGDPTDTNISISGIFTDFECAGYNSIVGEIAILFASLTTHGSYFYPKYNKNAYVLRTNLLFNYQKYKQDIVSFNDPDGKCILIPKFTILKKNKKVLLRFLKFYNKYFKNDLEINKYLKYYICMRILTPIDIEKMDEYDTHVIISLLIYLYENCTDINSLIKIINKMKVRKN